MTTITELMNAVPLSLGVLVIVAMLLFAGGITLLTLSPKRPSSGGVSARATSVPLQPVKPPSLAPEIVRPAGGGGSVPLQDNSLRYLLLGLFLLILAVIAWRYFAVKPEQAAELPTPTSVARADATPSITVRPGAASSQQDAPSAPQRQDVVPTDPTCEAPVSLMPMRRISQTSGVVTSWQYCDTAQQAQVDVIDVLYGDTLVYQPRWLPEDGTRLAAATVPAAFELTPRAFDLRAAPEAELSEYDAYITIGMAGFEIAPQTAQVRAAARAHHLAEFVLGEVRGYRGARDCEAQADVMAVSVGQHLSIGATPVAEDLAVAAEVLASENFEAAGVAAPTPVAAQPVVLGVRFDRRTPDNQRDLDRLVANFLESRGATLPGINLKDFGPVETVYTQAACGKAVR